MAFPILFVGFFSPSTSIDEMIKSIEKERNRFLPFSLKLFLIFLEKSGEKRQQHEAEQEMEQKKQHETAEQTKTAESTWKGTRKSFVRNSRFFWRSTTRVEMSMGNLWRCRVRRLERKQLARVGGVLRLRHAGTRPLQPKHAN